LTNNVLPDQASPQVITRDCGARLRCASAAARSFYEPDEGDGEDRDDNQGKHGTEWND
jgi:hypothetical protein